MDQWCYDVSIIPVASTKFLYLHFWKCHISPLKLKLQHADKLERNYMINLFRKIWYYIDIGYKSVSNKNRRVTKRYLEYSKESTLNYSALNQFVGISTEKVCLFLSNVFAPLQRALLVDSHGENLIDKPPHRVKGVLSRGNVCVKYRHFKFGNVSELKTCISRSSHSQMFFKIGVLKIFKTFQRIFPVNFAKFWRRAFL